MYARGVAGSEERARRRAAIDAHLTAAVRTAIEATLAEGMVIDNPEAFTRQLVDEVRDLMRDRVRVFAGNPPSPTTRRLNRVTQRPGAG